MVHAKVAEKASPFVYAGIAKKQRHKKIQSTADRTHRAPVA